MIVPYIIVCPTCGSRIFVKIQKADYLPEYPIRINCGKCKTLIKGTFAGEDSKRRGGLHLYNATSEDPIPVNLKINAAYYIEIAGEIPARKIASFDGIIVDKPSPFLEAVSNMDAQEMLEYKDRLRAFYPEYCQWQKTYCTAFQLLQDGSFDYIPVVLKNQIGEYVYECDNILKTLYCLQERIILATQYIFIKPINQKEILQRIHILLANLPYEELDAFLDNLKNQYDLITLYIRLVNIFVDFMNVYPNLLPAEAILRYKNKKLKQNTGISTCTFSDLKIYYQDTYETLLSMMDIPVCLDNINCRKNWNAFAVHIIRTNKDGTQKRINNISDYRNLANGKRLEFLDLHEPFQQIIAIPANSKLRNGIGHNNIKYDGTSQTISILNKKDYENVIEKISLIDFAVDCIGLMKSAVIMSEIILALIRYDKQKEGIKSIISPQLYSKKISPNDKCPCGSGIKYKKCCKHDLEKVLSSKKQ